MPQKRTITSYFSAPSKRRRSASASPPPQTDSGTQPSIPHPDTQSSGPPSTHPSYPHPIPSLPPSLLAAFSGPAPSPPRPITRPDLDLLYFQPLLPRAAAAQLFTHLRASLPFYRVAYTTRRPGSSAPLAVKTPRYTSVFGVDDSARFACLPANTKGNPKESPVAPPQGAAGHTPESEPGPLQLVTRASHAPLPARTYSCAPRPVPRCLEALRALVEERTGASYNVALVNYYADGADGIAPHSDDERFLGPEPVIASVSLGAEREFVMRARSAGAGSGAGVLRLSLASGDMLLMRGRTQAAWTHSVPKTKAAGGGRINVTFRRARARAGTENYYHYNVGDGPAYAWDARRGEMVLRGGGGKC